MTCRVLALSGGIGGAKLVLGLAQICDGDELVVLANTGDDFEHCGLAISPDVDTLLYTLSGRSDPERGWGLANETWNFMEQLRRDNPDQAWFQLGDRDLETHRFRTEKLAGGASLSRTTELLAQDMGIAARILPMSDDPVRTCVLAQTAEGEKWLPFQEYFVKHHCDPVISRIVFRGSEEARVQPELRYLAGPSLEAIILGPSNPFLSIDPILSVPGLTEQLRSFGVPVIAVSPIVGGRAIKGPAAKIMSELGLEVDTVSVARHYRGLVDGMVIDHEDRNARSSIEALGMQVSVEATVMNSMGDRVGLAQACLNFAAVLKQKKVLR